MVWLVDKYNKLAEHVTLGTGKLKEACYTIYRYFMDKIVEQEK